MDLREERAQLVGDLEAMQRLAENRALTDEEQAKWDTSIGRIEEIDAILARRTALSGVGEADTAEVRAATIENADDPKLAEARTLAQNEPAAKGGERRVAVNEPSPYSPAKGAEQRSYYRDVLLMQRDSTAAETLAANARVQWDEASPEQRQMLLSPDADGGYYAPPLHLVETAGQLLREQATIAASLPSIPHPGVAHVTWTKATAGLTVSSPGEDEPIPKSKQTLDQVDIYSERIKGSVEASDELLTFAAAAVDQLLTADLVGAYIEELERQVAAGEGHASKELPGFLTISGTQPVTFTAGGDIEQVDFWVAARKAKGAIRKPGKRVATHIAWAPRRATWFETAVDADSRPLVPLQNAINALATKNQLHNMEVVESGLIPENLGDDTDQDGAVAYYAPDFPLAQGPMRMIVSKFTPITVDGEVQLKDNAIFALTRDVMFFSEKRPSSAAVISGTGMALSL